MGRKLRSISLVLALAGVFLSSASWGQSLRSLGDVPWNADEPDPRSGESSRPSKRTPNEFTPPKAGFEHEQFVFARLDYEGYRADYPDADINFSLRLQELTSISVAPPKLLSLSDPNFEDHPFIYLSGPADSRGEFRPSPEDILRFRHYMQNGGFVVTEETWGLQAFRYFSDLMQEILPDVVPVELNETHDIFRIPYNMRPNIETLGKLPQMGSDDSVTQDYSMTWEKNSPSTLQSEREEDLKYPRFLAYYDNKGRMMMLWCHNNDMADGWQEEGQGWLFDKYSTQIAYPLMFNIVIYAMTH